MTRRCGPFAEHAPDLVCLDVMMPAPAASRSACRLRDRPEHAGLPILLLTALDRPEDKAHGLEAGASDFLSKPFDANELAARLRSLLRTKALQDRLADLLGRYVSENVAAGYVRDPSAVSWVAIGGRSRRCSPTCAATPRWPPSTRPRRRWTCCNRYLTVVSDAVELHGGTVADFLGDGVIACFGAPVVHADDPERAVRSCVAMQDEVMRLQIPTLPGVRLHLGIGITDRRGHRRQRRIRAAHALHRRR